MLHNPYSHHHYEVPNVGSPYDEAIPQGLVPGKQISISGHVRPGADRLSFNLMGPGGYILHINPRMHDGCVVRNHENYGNWGDEERDGPMPFVSGAPYNLVISVEEDKYRISVNGQLLFEFLHRIPLEQVERLMIDGDVDVGRIVYSSGGVTRHHNSFRPQVPFEAPVSNGPTPGRLVQIRGIVPQGADRFDVNLQNGPGVYPPDISFHVSVRFDQDCVVFNNCQGGAWGGEQRHPLTLHAGQRFELLVLFEPESYKLAVNGQHLGEMVLRNSPHEATFVAINGAVELSSVNQF